MTEQTTVARLEQEIQSLRQENSELLVALNELRSKLTEPAEVIRAIRQGEIDALVVQEGGEEEIYSLQPFDSVYRTVVEECFPYGVWLAKPDGRLLYVTNSFLELLQTDLGEMQEKGQFHFLPPETREVVERQWAKCRETGEAWNTEYTIRLGDGSEKTIWTQGLLARTPDGLSHWVGINIDVTQQAKTEQALRLSEERFRLMADAMPQIVWVTRPDGYQEYCNQRWYEYIGCLQEECIGHGWKIPLHPDDQQGAVERWDLALRTGRPFEIECRVRGKDGQYRWFLGRALPVRDETDSIVRWFGTCTDIDDKKRMEQELRQQAEALKESDCRKDEFLATLAHELRNPLAPIRSALDLIRLDEDDPAMHEQALAVMDQQLHQMVRLIDDLLDVARITRNKLELKRERATLQTVIERAMETSQPLIQAHGHHLKVSLPAEPLGLDADPVRLSQVFSNLLNNALKFTPSGGNIWLAAQREGADVLVWVRDSGIGIPAEMLPRIFDMFVQVDRSLEKSQGGLGIGLTLVKRLVEMHGGSVSAQSPGEGQGSEFLVRLPLATANGQASGPPASKSDRLPSNRHRILVVDDNRAGATMLATYLEALGHEVCTAHDGQEALARAESTRPELILLDIGLPVLNGYEVAKRIRAQPWGKEIVLAAQTGYGQEEDRLRSAEAGFDHHLVKPIEQNALLSLVANLPSAPPTTTGS